LDSDSYFGPIVTPPRPAPTLAPWDSGRLLPRAHGTLFSCMDSPPYDRIFRYDSLVGPPHCPPRSPFVCLETSSDLSRLGASCARAIPSPFSFLFLPSFFNWVPFASARFWGPPAIPPPPRLSNACGLDYGGRQLPLCAWADCVPACIPPSVFLRAIPFFCSAASGGTPVLPFPSSAFPSRSCFSPQPVFPPDFDPSIANPDLRPFLAPAALSVWSGAV